MTVAGLLLREKNSGRKKQKNGSDNFFHLTIIAPKRDKRNSKEKKHGVKERPGKARAPKSIEKSRDLKYSI